MHGSMPGIVKTARRKRGCLDEIQSQIRLEGNLDEAPARAFVRDRHPLPSATGPSSSEIKIRTTEA